jgi:hypothetical protein
MEPTTSNPYKLAGKGVGPAAPTRATVLTEAEKADKLRGYVELPRDCWENAKYGTHVRYVTKDGSFRSGGFIVNNPFDTKVRGTAVEKRFFKLKNGFNKAAGGFKEWIVAYEDVEFFYAKPTGVERATHQRLEKTLISINATVRTINENASQIAKQYKKLEGRVAALESRLV